jgi:CubicO group peptidase (beta-lactamase class C family)
VSSYVKLLAFSAVLAVCTTALDAQSVKKRRPRTILKNAAARVDSRELGEKSARVDALFAPWSKPGMPGAAVIVIYNGEILHKKGYGFANIKKKVPIAPDTSFRLASVTKQFTAMAIMILAERGVLQYSDPLSKFFPQFRGIARTVTIEHLLHHQAGFPEYEDLYEADGAIDTNWPRSIKSTPSAWEPTSRDTLRLLARLKELQFKPGDKYVYSNSGYVILGQVIRKATGKSYRAFLEDEIFGPLRSESSVVSHEIRPSVPHRATSYSWIDGKYREIDYSPLNRIYGEDGVYTTIEDMAKWDRALLFSGKLVKPSTLERAFTPGRLNNGTITDYGYGWVVDSATVSHNGEWLGFRTNILRYLAQNFTVVVLSNCGELNATAMCQDIAHIYLVDD